MNSWRSGLFDPWGSWFDSRFPETISPWTLWNLLRQVLGAFWKIFLLVQGLHVPWRVNHGCPFSIPITDSWCCFHPYSSLIYILTAVFAQTGGLMRSREAVIHWLEWKQVNELTPLYEKYRFNKEPRCIQSKFAINEKTFQSKMITESRRKPGPDPINNNLAELTQGFATLKILSGKYPT